MGEKFLSVREIAERLAVRPHVVLAHIASGSLPATDVSTTRTRPHWRISVDDLDRFMEQRTRRPAPSRQRRRRSEPVNRHF